MASPFEDVARVAITEMILDNTKESKFGYILTKEGVEKLTDSFYDLLQTSRSLQNAGDRLMGMGTSDKVPPASRRR